MKQKSRWGLIPSRERPRLIWLLGVLVPIISAVAGPAFGAVEITDDRGRTVRLERPARRIIALYGAFNEILDALGLADRIAARTSADRLPPSIVEKPVIGTHMRPNYELVLGQRPDLVLQMAGRDEASQAVEVLEKYGVPTALFRVDSFDDLFALIKRLGVLTNVPDRADGLIAKMKARLDRVGALILEPTRPTVFFEVRYPNLLGAGGGSMVDEIIRAAGGKNVLVGPKKFFRLGEEELLRLDPDFYLIQQGPMNPNPIPLDQRSHFLTLNAVENGRVLMVDEQKYSRPGPRNLEAVEELAAWLHPEAATRIEHGREGE
ncbi:MAG: ABC transporter substrate-binding protein [Pseudomonadota bacterium]